MDMPLSRYTKAVSDLTIYHDMARNTKQYLYNLFFLNQARNGTTMKISPSYSGLELAT